MKFLRRTVMELCARRKNDTVHIFWGDMRRRRKILIIVTVACISKFTARKDDKIHILFCDKLFDTHNKILNVLRVYVINVKSYSEMFILHTIIILPFANFSIFFMIKKTNFL